MAEIGTHHVIPPEPDDTSQNIFEKLNSNVLQDLEKFTSNSKIDTQSTKSSKTEVYEAQMNLKANAPSECEENRLFQCNSCAKEFTQKLYLLRHCSIAHTHQCKHCDKIFTKEIDLMRHISIVHKEQTQFQCTICDQKFDRKLSLKTHNSQFHKYPCNFCEKKFAIKLHLRKHK